MDILPLFFLLDADPGLLIYGSYNPWLVALSVAIAVFSSVMALNAASQAGSMHSRHLRRVTLLAGSLSLGCGVWAMHFIGMLSFALCTTVKYDVGITTASLLPSIAASWVALNLLAQDRVTTRQLLISGALVGAGIGAMHYAGMAAMNMPAHLRYDPWMFTLSIVVAVVLAVLALWIRFGMGWLMQRQPVVVLNALAGTVMGLAISGMHYTGMAAARFIGASMDSSVISLNDPVPLALSISLVTVVATVLVAAASGLAQYRQLVEQLQGKETKLQAILDTTLDAIVVFDHEGNIVRVNPGGERIYGWRSDELVGQSIARIMVEPFRTEALQHMPAFMERLARVVGVEFIGEGQHRDGHTMPVRLVLGKTVVDHHDLYVAYVSDVSERVQMESALRGSEAQFRTLIANIPGIAYRCRMARGWPMVFISDAVERITGFAPSEFLGDEPSVRFASLLPEDEVQKVADIVKTAVDRGDGFVLEFRLRHRDGSWRWMWGNGSIVRDDDGEVQYIDGVLLDISERRQMEEELREAKECAEAAATARSTFLANMSHEIRTPMNAIIGFTEVVLASPGLPEAQRTHLETVRRAARSLLHLLNDILDSSKLERGALELECLDFNLHDFMAQLCAEQAVQAARKGLQLRHEIDSSAEPYVRGDPHRLRQVLINLLGNAVKFTEAGSVTLTVRRDGEMMHFSVIDTGIGIPADRQESIFEPFTQADASMSRRFGGTGLGTTISKQLVELMNGRIWVESTPGEGSIFHVSVPLAVGQEALAIASGGADITSLPPLNILAVDDVPQNTELLQVSLGRLGHTVVVAYDGLEAVSCYQRMLFDVVLMDVQMPVMDGLQATRAMREAERAQGRGRTPIVALSASVLPEDRAAAVDAGMDGFAVKPVELPQLLAEIARVTGQSVTPVPEVGRSDVDSWMALNPEIVDQQRALRRWGQMDAYRQALQRFMREQQGWLDQPSHLHPPDDLQHVAAQAHRLKGASSNLGLSLCAAACEQLEQSARTESVSAVSVLWAEMREALALTLASLQPVLAAAPADEYTASEACASLGPLPPQTWTLSQLVIQALQRGEPLEQELSTLMRDLAPWVEVTRRQQVLQAVEDFDFDRAVLALRALMSEVPMQDHHEEGSHVDR